jgi:multiple sugar transport system permease protein
MTTSRKAQRRRKAILNGLGRHSFGMTTAFLFLAPLVWSVLVSFKQAPEARKPPLPPWPTQGATLDNYLMLDNFGAGIMVHAGNSLIVSVGTVVISVVVSLLAGYGFSRFRFPFKDHFFVLIIMSIMVPFQSILTPLFLILSRLGLQNSLVGLILVYVTLQLPFSVFMMRNAFDAVPKEIEEAARVDGASVWHVLVKIMLPLVFPGVVTVAIFAFLNSWNEFLAALIFMTDQDQYTLPILMTAVASGQFGTINWGAIQSGVTIMMLPCLALFLLLQRYYVRGLTAGAVK